MATRTGVLTAAALATLAAMAPAATVTTNVVDGNQFAWGENIGWTNWRGQGTGDAATPPPRIGPQFCSGFVWCENVGWLNLGDGSPSNGASYSQAAGDTGVNVSPTGALSGYAWGENIGWVHFDWTPTDGGSIAQRPFVDVANGRFVGYAWGENVGWINFNGSATGGSSARLRVQPTAEEIAEGLVNPPLPLGSDVNADGINADAADVVARVNAP